MCSQNTGTYVKLPKGILLLSNIQKIRELASEKLPVIRIKLMK